MAFVNVVLSIGKGILTLKANGKSECECPEGYDEMYHCEKCDECCFNWGLFKEGFMSYEDRGVCLQCSMNDGMTLQEAQYLLDA